MLALLVVVLLVSSGGVIAMLSPDLPRCYPTAVRGHWQRPRRCRQQGWRRLRPFAGRWALGALAWLHRSTVAVPMAFGAGKIAAEGVETRGRVLEEIRPKDDALTQTHETG
ncbi:MAG TPA: hypothetical protein VK988_20180 [Acidimicrobiales bacterium]|nr:hypothetical protein [Acidimicrobiales bacterium]